MAPTGGPTGPEGDLEEMFEDRDPRPRPLEDIWSCERPGLNLPPWQNPKELSPKSAGSAEQLCSVSPKALLKISGRQLRGELTYTLVKEQ